MQYRLRTLLILLALMPPLLWGAFALWQWAMAPPSDMLIYDSYFLIETDQGTQRIPWPPK